MNTYYYAIKSLVNDSLKHGGIVRRVSKINQNISRSIAYTPNKKEEIQ